MASTTLVRGEIVRLAAESAVLAPSVHNTQPWRFRLTDTALEIHSDRSRQLWVLDPTGRQLLISIGCAAFNARVAAAVHGYETTVEAFPDPNHRGLVARVVLAEKASDWVPIARYHPALSKRQTNRRRFTEGDVPPELVYELIRAAEGEGARLTEVRHPDHRLAVARLTQRADAQEVLNPAYRAELRQWTSDDPTRPDGVPAMAVPHVNGLAQDDIPIRDFDTHGFGWLPSVTHSSLEQCLLVLGTDSDDELGWLTAGQALEHLWLEATLAGYSASLFTQPIEVPFTRERLRTELALTMHPHALLRIGHAAPAASSRRRRLSDMLMEEES